MVLQRPIECTPFFGNFGSRLDWDPAPGDYDRWLGIPDNGDPRPPLDLLHPYDAARMKMTPPTRRRQLAQ
jgi:hypothetical protein